MNTLVLNVTISSDNATNPNIHIGWQVCSRVKTKLLRVLAVNRLHDRND